MSEPQGLGGFDFSQLGEMLSRLGRAFSSGGDGSFFLVAKALCKNRDHECGPLNAMTPQGNKQ